MDKMTSFERVKKALEHKEADRVPFDLGGTVVSGMNKVAYENLRDYLNLPNKEVEIYDVIQQLAKIDNDMIERLKVDIRGAAPSAPNNDLTTEIKKVGKYYSFKDEWGITWNMPVNNGLYFDMRKHPLENIDTVKGLEEYSWPDPLDEGRFVSLKERADKYVFEEERAYVLGRIGAGIFELALWMRGYENFYMDMAINKAFAEALLDKIMRIKMKYWEKALDTVGENVLIISEADDLATQESLLISPKMYREFISPKHKKLFEFIKKKAKTKVNIFYHSCGAVKELIPDLIEEGIDILNPVQVNANNMNTKELKKEFGKDLVFWGGIDTQEVLPNGTTKEIKYEVKKRIEDLSKDGGYIFNPVHNVQADVSAENYMTMWKAMREYGVY